MRYTLLEYAKSHNVGDALQTIALSRLLGGDVDYLLREKQSEFVNSDENKLISNGYQWFPLSEDKTVLYAGVYLWQHKFDTLAEFLRGNLNTIGTRDPYTHRKLLQKGIRNEMCGCVTTTLPRYYGEREGEYDVALGKKHRDVWIRTDSPWDEQMRVAEENLEFFRKAKSITTDKLHVTIPCLALGTPVRIKYDSLEKVDCPERLTILLEMGFKFDVFNEIDMTPFAERFKQFLYTNLGIDPIIPSEKDCPVPV